METMPLCPEPDELEQLLLGLLPAARCDVLESHLGECENCLSRLRDLQPRDVLVEAVLNLPQQTAGLHATRESIDSVVVRVLAQRKYRVGGDTVVEGRFADQTHSVNAPPAHPLAAGASPPPAPAAVAHPLQIPAGSVLGNYRILELIGQGGMGAVYKAEHARMARVVALKVLTPALVRNAEAVQRFQREIHAIARLSHANIVIAFDADEAQGVHFLAMEYVAGADLASIVKRQGPLPIERAVGDILQAARGLEYAHAEGVVHRDIKRPTSCGISGASSKSWTSAWPGSRAPSPPVCRNPN